MGTFSPNLTLSEMTPFDPAVRNSWATTLNQDLTLIDSAVAGILTLGVGGNADVTLSSVQGAPDQARNQDFVFTGVLTGNINVFWPVGRNRFFSVKNATTGAFTLTIAVTGTPGTTVAVPQGQTVMLKSDGTNISPRFSALTGITLTNTALIGGASADLLTIVTDQIFTRPVVAGTGNAITLAYATSPGAYVDGAKFAFKATAANTGATTVNINGLGVRIVLRKGSAGSLACVGGEINIADIVEIEYDGAQFQITSDTVPTLASKVLMQVGNDNTTMVTPARVNDSDGVAKAWFFGSSAGGGTTGYNVGGAVRNSVGNYTLSFITAFASGNYAMVGTADDGTNMYTVQATSKLAGSVNIVVRHSSTGTLTDVNYNVVFYGRQ